MCVRDEASFVQLVQCIPIVGFPGSEFFGFPEVGFFASSFGEAGEVDQGQGQVVEAWSEKNSFIAGASCFSEKSV